MLLAAAPPPGAPASRRRLKAAFRSVSGGRTQLSLEQQQQFFSCLNLYVGKDELRRFHLICGVAPPDGHPLPASGVSSQLRPSVGLPPEWSYHVDPATGQDYFYNTITDQRQWAPPQAGCSVDSEQLFDPLGKGKRLIARRRSALTAALSSAETHLLPRPLSCGAAPLHTSPL